MKKILIVLLALTIPTTALAASYMDKQLKEAKKNAKYNTTQKYKRDFNTADSYIKKSTKSLKDPKLFTLSSVTPVDENLYKQKLSKDEEIYKNTIIPAISKKTNTINIEPEAVDFYKVYRVSEKLIRANNLDYTNWRIAIRKTPDEINAASGAVNFVYINTALYDSIYENEDALAFVLAHELSHLILGHSQRMLVLRKRIKNFTAKDQDAISSSVALMYLPKAYSEMRMMEFMADAEAFTLLIRAGFSPSKALEALNFLDLTAQLKSPASTRPHTKERLESANENILFANPNWVEEGKANIYNSKVLTCKKSSDRVSIVINKSDNISKIYEPENIVQKLTRMAYSSYIKGNMNYACKYFKKLAEITDDYKAYLYLSYAQEQLYFETNDNKYQKQALKSAQKAKELNSNEINVEKQLNDLKDLL